MTRLPTLGRRGEGWVILQLVLLAATVLAGLAGPAWDGVARGMTTGIGVLLLATGGLLAGRGMMDLRENLTPLPHPRDDARLVQSGVYGLVRHPIYGGIILGSTGWALLTASLVALGMALVLAAFFALKSNLEEAWCVDRFAEYPAYRARTRRFIPGLW